MVITIEATAIIRSTTIVITIIITTGILNNDTAMHNDWNLARFTMGVVSFTYYVIYT